MEEHFDSKIFNTMPVCELVLGNKELGQYHFIIPSFQRGYRWEEKQVEDLLDDIKQFADDEDKANESYYLQPIVVKSVKDSVNTWEVIDGQQRLTTLMLLLKRLKKRLSDDDKDYYSDKGYTIVYKNRPQLNFDNPELEDNIDSYYVSEAKTTIDNWFKEHRGKGLDGLTKVLLYGEEKRQVKIIWYPIYDESKEVESINIFNRLNNGKIGLTSSELIKALFILKSKTDKHIDTNLFAIEWDAIERKLQDESFWYFISNKPDGYQTRIDLLFDFVTVKEEGQDIDYSYRKFQKLFDFCKKKDMSIELDKIWEKRDRTIDTMEKAWNEVKRVYDRLLAWYEDNMFYHYVGFLIAEGDSPLSIYKALEDKKKKEEDVKEWSVEDSKSALHELIREKFKIKNHYLTTDDIRELDYNSSTLVRRTLLLFNIETCIKNQRMRFAFNEYRRKENKWDIEQVNSQNDSDIQKVPERKNWLKNVTDFLEQRKENESCYSLWEKGKELLSRYESKASVSNDEYQNYYRDVNRFFAPNMESIDKNNIGNLTLLDSGTNREYHDAPFPYKRQCIIEKDREGKTFIPVCTRNLFLKYYSEKEIDSSQFDNMHWNKTDMDNYLKKLIDTIAPIINTTAKEGGNHE